MKVIRAQLYVPYDVEDVIITMRCEQINKEIEGWPISYDCYVGDINDDSVIGFEVDCEANTFKDAEALYQIFKKSVHKEFKHRPKEKIKMKLERVI